MSRHANPEPRVRVAFEIPLIVRQQLVALAETQGTTMTALVREALIRYVEEESQ